MHRKLLITMLIIIAITAGFLLLSWQVTTAAEGETKPVESPLGMEPYIWDPIELPSKNCLNTNLKDCLNSSPNLVDIDGNGSLDIVVATNNGHIVVVRPNGQILWDRDISGEFSMPPDRLEINSSPSVGDIDNDGHMEIVVGVGTIHPQICNHGGVIALSHTGQTEPGWPQHSEDWAVDPVGCRDSIFATPALGNLDDDPELEIVAGGFDMRLYAWNHDGTLLPGFPPDSWLRERYNWSVLEDHLADVMWSSPTLADMDGDGYLDIVTGTSEGNQGDGWHCPYRLPNGWRSGYCGGSIYIVNRFGELTFGRPYHILETIQSSPAVTDLDLDGYPDIVVGTGDFYRNHSPDHPEYGFQLLAWDRFGNDLPGWGPDEPEGWGGNVNGPVTASPSIGDIAGDEKPEVVVAVKEERKLYAWHHDGRPVAGFPMTPVDLFGQTISSFDVGTGFLLADYDGDSKMEILFSQGWVVTVVDGDGRQITAPSFPNGLPIYYTNGSLLNNPVVGDIDGDNRLEMLSANSFLYGWELANSHDNAEWLMWKLNPERVPTLPLPARLALPVDELFVFKDRHEPGPLITHIEIKNMGDIPMNWTAERPTGVILSPSSGTIGPRGTQSVRIQVDRSILQIGYNNISGIRFHATTGNGETVPGSPAPVSMRVFFGDTFENLLPMILNVH